jgi:hypothetical protein
MGEYGAHIGWKFFEKLLWARCPIGINKGRILHYIQSIQHEFWAHFIVIALLRPCFVFAIKFCWILILQYLCSYYCFSYFMFYIWDWACLCYCIGLGNIIDLVVFVHVTIWTNSHVFVWYYYPFVSRSSLHNGRNPCCPNEFWTRKSSVSWIYCSFANQSSFDNSKICFRKTTLTKGATY